MNEEIEIEIKALKFKALTEDCATNLVFFSSFSPFSLFFLNFLFTFDTRTSKNQATNKQITDMG